MKILKDPTSVIRFWIRRARQVKKKDGTLEIWKAGSIVEIPTKNWAEQLSKFGPFSNLDPIDIPEMSSYKVVIKSDFRESDGKIKWYSPGDTATLERDCAIRAMLECGRVRPISPDVSDLSVFALFRYKSPDDPDAALRAKPVHEQEKDRREHEAIEREKEKAVFQATEHMASLKKKPFVAKW